MGIRFVRMVLGSQLTGFFLIKEFNLSSHFGGICLVLQLSSLTKSSVLGLELVRCRGTCSMHPLNISALIVRMGFSGPMLLYL